MVENHLVEVRGELRRALDQERRRGMVENPAPHQAARGRGMMPYPEELNHLFILPTGGAGPAVYMAAVGTPGSAAADRDCPLDQVYRTGADHQRAEGCDRGQD